MIQGRNGGSARRRLLAKGLLSVPLLGLAGRAGAQAPDDGPLRLVAGFETAGPGDVLTRVVAI